MLEIKKKEIVENLIPSFQKSGDISLKLREQGLKTEIKKDNTPVTNGDIEVNKLITNKFWFTVHNIKHRFNFWDVRYQFIIH